MTRMKVVSALRTAILAVMLLVAAATAVHAGEVPWGEAELFFELNDTDGDLGIHSSIDGEPWKTLRIESPNDRALVDIKASSRMRQQGLTQLMFESAEPNFDDFTAEEFFARFPEGDYDIVGLTLENVELESEIQLSHVMAAPVANVTVNGQAVPEDCDADPGPTVSPPVVVDWDPVTMSHPEIGASGPVVIELYEFFIETDEVKLSAVLPPDVTDFDIPSGYLAFSDEWKLEILVRTDTHNNTSIETCFVVQ